MDPPSSDDVTCQKHGQKYQYFCETCQELVCLECVDLAHPSQSHSLTNLERAAAEGRKSTQTLLTQLDEKLPELEDSLRVFKQLHPILKKHSKRAIAEVQAFATKIRIEVTKQEKQLLEEIRQKSHQQNKDLNLACESLSESITHARFSRETGLVFTKRSTDGEFLRHRAIIEKDLHRLVDKQRPSMPRALGFLAHDHDVTLGALKEVDIERSAWNSIQEMTSSSDEYFSLRRPSQQKPKQNDISLKETANAEDITKFQPKPGDWKCYTCLLTNKKDEMSCIACMTPKPGTVSTSFSSKPPSQKTGVGGGFKFGTSSLDSDKTPEFRFAEPLFGSTTSFSSAPAIALPSKGVTSGSTKSKSTLTTTMKKAQITSHPSSKSTLETSLQKLDLGESGDKTSDRVLGSQSPSAGFSFGAEDKATGSSAAANLALSKTQQVLSVRPSGGFTFRASTSTSTQPGNKKPQSLGSNTAESNSLNSSFRSDDKTTTVASTEKTPKEKYPGFGKTSELNKSSGNAIKTTSTNMTQPTVNVLGSKSIVGSSTFPMTVKDSDSTETSSTITDTPPKSVTATPAGKGSNEVSRTSASPASATVSESTVTDQKPQVSTAATSASQSPFAGFTFSQTKPSTMTATFGNFGSKGSSELPNISDKTANPTDATISAAPSFSFKASQLPLAASENTQQKHHVFASGTSLFTFSQVKSSNTVAPTFGNLGGKGSKKLPKTSDRMTVSTASTFSASSPLFNSLKSSPPTASKSTQQKPQASAAATSTGFTFTQIKPSNTMAFTFGDFGTKGSNELPKTSTTATTAELKFGSPAFGIGVTGTPGHLDSNECHDSDSDDDVIFVSEKQPTPDQRARAEALMLPPTYFLYEDEPPCPGCVGCDPKDLAARGITLSKHSPSPKASGGTTFHSPAPDAPGLLASKGQGQKGFSFSKAEALFENDNKESTAEGQEYDPHFDPIVELPELVDIKTGEEDEEVMYRQRARLYRFAEDLGVWKERGIGDVKLLRHRDTGMLRLIMRREQVLKLCANHRISTDLKLNRMKSSDCAWVWHAIDYAEVEPCHEQFAIKFKTPVLAYEFKQCLEELQAVRREEEMMASGSSEKAKEPDLPEAAETEKTNTKEGEGAPVFSAFQATTSTTSTTQPTNEKLEKHEECGVAEQAVIKNEGDIDQDEVAEGNGDHNDKDTDKVTCKTN